MQRVTIFLPSFYTPCKILVVEDNYKYVMSIPFKKVQIWGQQF